MSEFSITRAMEADAPDLGVIGPAAYAAAYHDDWDDAVGFFHQLKTFGEHAMVATLARPEARVWIARQESAGIVTAEEPGSPFIRHVDMGLVSTVFKNSDLERLKGSRAIGHVRYATCGHDDRSYAQPFERHHIKKHKWFSFAL
mgnify:CR=1 FL=1